MTARTKSEIKAFFQTGDKPTQSQFEDLIDSYQDVGLNPTSYETDTGTANTYVISPDTALTSYTEGISYAVKISNSNTGASTLNVSGLGAKDITYIDGTAMSSGVLVAGGIVLLYYDGTRFLLTNISPTSSSSGGITALTGDVTASGIGSVAATIATDAVTTTKILDASVTNAKLNDMAANTVKARAASTSGVPSDVSLAASQLLGRGSSGDISAISLGSGLSMSGTTVSVSTTSGINTITRQVFTSSGTYTPSSGLVYAEIEVVGGGGPGSDAGGGTYNGGGGGAGGYARELVTAATIGASQSVTIGSGGLNSSGSNGGTSSVGSILSATGGSAAAATPVGGQGGVGSSGDINMRGGSGGNGSGTGSSNGAGGPGGNSFFGGGGYSTSSTGASGQTNSGGGGAGGTGTTNDGGNGGSGIVIITEYRTV